MWCLNKFLFLYRAIAMHSEFEIIIHKLCGHTGAREGPILELTTIYNSTV